MKPLQRMILLMSSLAAMASSTPQLPSLEARESPWIGVYICPEHDWKPTDLCHWKKMDIDETKRGRCFNFDDPENSENLSFGPDRGIWCKVYTNLTCQGDGYLVNYPGTPDLGQLGLSMGNAGALSNSKFQSFGCGKYDCDASGKCTFHDPADRDGTSQFSQD